MTLVISVSLDGYVAVPNPSLVDPLGEREVLIGGGADVARQYLNAGHVDTVQLHIAPVVLGAGTRLLDGVDPGLNLTIADAVHSPTVTHIRYDVA